MKVSKLFAMLLTVVVPGAGHLILRQYFRASLLLFFFIIMLDGVIVGRAGIAPFGLDNAQTAFWCTIGAAAVWLLAVGHTAYLCFFFDEEAHQQRVDAVFQQGQREYLRGDYEAAITTFKHAARLDRDDPDARFYLASVYQATGRRWKARRALHKCHHLDLDGKWDWEVSQAHAALKRRKDNAADGSSKKAP